MGAPNIPKDIRDYLVSLGITPVTVDMLAPSPIVQYAVILYGGTNVKTHGGGVSGGAGVALDEGKLQIQARHTTNQGAKTNILSVVNALDGNGDFVVNGVTYTYIQEVSAPRFFAKEESGASVFIWECLAQCRRG